MSTTAYMRCALFPIDERHECSLTLCQHQAIRICQPGADIDLDLSDDIGGKPGAELEVVNLNPVKTDPRANDASLGRPAQPPKRLKINPPRRPTTKDSTDADVDEQSDSQPSNSVLPQAQHPQPIPQQINPPQQPVPQQAPAAAAGGQVEQQRNNARPARAVRYEGAYKEKTARELAREDKAAVSPPAPKKRAGKRHRGESPAPWGKGGKKARAKKTKTTKKP